MKWKRADGESAKALREQAFLSIYKPEPGIVNSSVSRPSAYCQYCCYCPWSSLKIWKKMCSYLYSSVNMAGYTAEVFEYKHGWVHLRSGFFRNIAGLANTGLLAAAVYVARYETPKCATRDG